MLNNYIITALRNILKNRLYALINIAGLAIGLAVYVAGTVLVDYERNHDRNFANFDRIYTVSSLFSPSMNIGFRATDGAYSAFVPIMKASISELEYAAQIRRDEFLLSVGENDFYQDIRFTSPDFTRIFDFTYIHGDATAIDRPDGLMITRSTAMRLFGAIDVLGRSVRADHSEELTVTAVVEDLPANTHFNSSLVGTSKFEAVGNAEILKALKGYDADQNWGDLSLNNTTFVLLPEGRDAIWLQAAVSTAYDEHYPEDVKENIAGLEVVHLSKANTFLWDTVGLPVLGSISILGVLVLVVACVNYTNLAIAQSLGRAREVGLRRTMGANRTQLLTQFLTESLVTATVAMFMALVLLEAVIPAFNQLLGKAVSLNYGELLPWLLSTVLVVGVVSGGYPAFLIARTDPISALRDGAKGGRAGGLLRSAMIGLQFVIAIFMLATVMVMYFQNQRVRETINLFPTSQIYVLERMNIEGVEPRSEALRSELLRVPGVANVSFSNQVPFEQSNKTYDVSPVPGDESQKISLNRIRIDHDFLATYDIPLLAGRDLSRDISLDAPGDAARTINVVINELAASRLGLGSAGEAVGKSFFSLESEGDDRQHIVVGVMPDQNFLGLHNSVKPFVFYVSEDRFYASLRIKTDNMEGTIEGIHAVWNNVVPDFPIQAKFLNETFEGVYTIYRSVNFALSGFAAIALSLALIGLFGLAAFMAEQRTREIGIRRVLGASVPQLVRLLIWQFSKPVVWALAVALPLSYFAAGQYLNVFADRINLPIGIIAIAGIIGIAAAWSVVASHAMWVARANPITALRNE